MGRASLPTTTRAAVVGGGIFAGNSSRYATRVDFVANTVDDHGDDGGAIHVGRDGLLTYTGGRVEGSRANFNVGVSLQAADATITGVDFIRNIAFDDLAGMAAPTTKSSYKMWR